MSRLRLWDPRLLFTWQLLWLLVLAAEPPVLAPDRVQLTSDPPWLPEPWSSQSSDFTPESPHALIPPADPGGFNYLGSPAADQMLALPQELTETLVPFLETDSDGELHSASDQFAVPHQGRNNKLTQHQRRPEEVPKLSWGQNQALSRPPQLQSKTHSADLGQAVDNHSLGSGSSKPAKLIVSPPNLKQDLSQLPRYAKVGRTLSQLVKTPQRQEQQLQDDYLDPSMGVFHPEENLPMDFVEGPDKPSKSSEEVEISALQDAQAHHLEPLEFEPSLQQEALTQHPQSLEQAESFSPQAEAQAQHPEHIEDMELLPLQQEAPSQPPESSQELVLPSEQEKSPPGPLDTLEEVEHSSVQQEPPAQLAEAPEEVETSLALEEGNVASPSRVEAQQLHSHGVTVNLQLTVTPTRAEEAESSPVQEEEMAQPSEHPEEAEPPPGQEEPLAQPVEHPEEVEPSPGQEEPLAQPVEHSAEVEPSPVQEETMAQPPEHPEEVESLPLEQESSDQHAQPHEEVTPFFTIPMSDVMSETDPFQAYKSSLPKVTLKPMVMELTVTSEPTKDIESSTQQEVPPQLPEPFGAVPSQTQEESSAQPPEPPNEAESLTRQETPEEAETSAILQEQPAQPPEPSPGEVKQSPTQQEQPTQPPEHREVTVSTPCHSHARHSNLPNVTIRPTDTQLTITAETTTAVGPSPVQHEAEVQPSVPLNSTQQKASAQLPQTSEEGEASATQQESPVQHPQAPEEGETSAAPTQYPEPFEEVEDVEPSPIQEEAQTQSLKLSKEDVVHSPVHHTTVFSLGQTQAQLPKLSNITVQPVVDMVITMAPQVTNVVETSPPQQESSTQSTLTPEQLKTLFFQQEVPDQQSPPVKNVTPCPIQRGVPSQPENLSEKTEPCPVLQENRTQPPQSSTDVVAQPSVRHEVTVSPLSSGKTQHTVLPNITVKSLDLGLSITPETTKAVEHSPVQQESPAQSPVLFKQDEVSPAQSKSLFQSSEFPKKVGSFPGQQEAIARTPGLPKEMKLSSFQQEALAEPSEPPKEIELSSTEQVSAYPPKPTEEIKLPTQEEALPQPSEKTESSSFLQKATALPLKSLKEMEPSLTQQVVQTQPSEPPEKMEPSSSLQQPPHQSPETPKEAIVQIPVYNEVEVSAPGQDQAQHSNLTSFTVQPLDLGLSISPEPAAEIEHSTALQKTTAPTKHPKVILPHPEQVQAEHSKLTEVTVQPLDLELAVTPGLITEVEPSPTMLKTPANPPESAKEVAVQPPESANEVAVQPPEPAKEVAVQPPEPAKEVAVQPQLYQVTVPTSSQDQDQQLSSPNVTVQPLDLEFTVTPEPPVEAEYSTALRQITTFPQYSEMMLSQPEQTQFQHPTLSEVTVQPLDLELTITPESNIEVEPSPTVQENPTQPPEPPKEDVVQPPLHQEATVPIPGQDQVQHPPSPDVTVEPLELGLTLTPEPITEVERSTAPPEYPEVTLPHPEQVQSQLPNLKEATVQPLDVGLSITPESSIEAESSPVIQETTIQPPEPPNEVRVRPQLYEEVTVSAPGQDQFQHPLSANVTVEPLDLGLTLTPELTTEVKHSTALQQTTAPPEYPEVTLPHLEQVQSQHPSLAEVTAQPLDTEFTVTPESSIEVEPSPIIQETPIQPPEPPNEVGVQPRLYQEITVPAPGQSQAQPPRSPSVTAYSLDLGLSETSETTEAKHSTAVQQTTAPSPEHPEVTLLHPENDQSQHPNLTKFTVQPMDLDITVTSGSNVEAETSPIMLNTQTQPRGTPSEGVVQYPFHQEVTVPTSSKDQAQYLKSPTVTVHHVSLELTVTPEPIAEAKHSTPLTNTTAPPEYLEVTVPHTRQVQSQHPNVTEVGLTTVNPKVTITQQPESSETGPPTTEQNATINIDICKLCACKDETLSCIGLSPKQRLRRVPAPESNIYNGTFTFLNFQGNSISYIDENIWNSYRWAEKLILGENHLSELHKDSFEGLLSLQYLDLSCNKIQSIERRTFEPLPFLQFIILNRNPLVTVEDSYLFKLPALKYLDMGTTQVSLSTVESILMLTLELEKLILPTHVACCLCKFKNSIEVVCKTVKLHCDTECLTNTSYCDEEIAIGNAEGSFMKVLQARKKNTSTELIIEPEKASSDKNGVSLSGFMNEQLDFNDESDVISALNYILPYFSEGNLEDVESILLPFIKLLFSNVQEGDMPLSLLKNNTKDSSLKPESDNSTYKNKLRKLYFLENLLDAEIQEKIDEVKKKEKTAMLINSNRLGPKFKRQIFRKKKLNTNQPQENSLAETQSVRRRLLRVNRVLEDPRGIQKRHFKEVGDQSIRRKQNARPIVENTVKERRLRRPSPRELEYLHMVHRPRKLVENSFNTEPSFINKHKAAVSSFLKQYSLGSPSDSTYPESLSAAKNRSKDFSYPIFILENANARVRNMKASELISHARKKHRFHKSRSHVIQKTPKPKTSRKFRKEGSLNRLMLAKRPLFSAVKSLINSPARESFSSSEELTSQENPDVFSFSETATENATAENRTAENRTEQTVFEENIPLGNITVPEEMIPKASDHENVSSADSAVTADNLMPTVKQTNETQWEYHNAATDVPSTAQGFTFPFFSSPGDQFETQLNQQLRSLIPNNDVRKLISHVIRTLKMDCSEVTVQLACAKLISRTGLLMKLLSEQQEVKVAKAEWDTDQWKNENYINESTEAQPEQKGGQELRELTKEVPGYGYNNKLILAISVTVVVMILIIIFCLIEIYSHRTASEEDEGNPRGFFRYVLRRKSSVERERQEGSFWKRRPLWLRDMYRPLNATRKKNMAQKLHDRDSSDEDEIFNKDKGEHDESSTEKVLSRESATEEPVEESQAEHDTVKD
ncbi:leucine-rich repeat-containing protein 37A3 isoform X2 [Rousettus aegyptiacus]|uniref:leucine-rich repeat-containing protein 37A3 isoform X2 n=1 Tax=Rousettus aegyptiacus TaxID=9407 RepID=UPI00168CAE40|nr:leucine-rich repeat-containing protein 37A3 isoform X2 [Rousettus aegyptiacus]